MPPAITPSPKMRGTVAPVRIQRCGYFDDFQFRNRRLHYHLAGKFHSGRLKSKTENGIPPETAKTAMKIPARAPKKQAPYGRQHRISDIPVQCRHRPWPDSATKTVSHDQIETFPETCHKQIECAEVIAVIAVAHDDECPTCRTNSSHKRAAISPFRDSDYPRAKRCCN